jgi:predicted nucleic acid-binding protein
MTKVFIDSDILIDLLAKREHHLAAARLLTIARDKKVHAFTTPIVLANVDYIITKHANRSKSKDAIRILRKDMQILLIDDLIVDRALESSFTDFEDALQYYAAEAANMDFIVTGNGRDYRFGNIVAVSAQEFVDLFAANEEVEA